MRFNPENPNDIFETVTLVWYIALEEFIEHHLGKRPDIQQREYGQETLRIVGTEPDEYYFDDSDNQITDERMWELVEGWMKGEEPEPPLEAILAYMAEKGFLPKDTVLYIHIWW